MLHHLLSKNIDFCFILIESTFYCVKRRHVTQVKVTSFLFEVFPSFFFSAFFQCNCSKVFISKLYLFILYLGIRCNWVYLSLAYFLGEKQHFLSFFSSFSVTFLLTWFLYLTTNFLLIHLQICVFDT